jgi:hypothetical protein
VYVVDQNTQLRYKFLMGIDKDEEILYDKLREYFKTDSNNCLIKDFRLVTKDDGLDYDISPNLM